MIDGNLEVEKNFSNLVLYEAKRWFTRKEQRYLGKSRMEKLVALVAQDLGYNFLTRGWYKFGLFAPAAWDFCSGSQNLENLYTPPTIPNGFFEDTSQIKRSILKFHDVFIKDEDTFYGWFYGGAPNEYRNFYFSKMAFEKNLNMFTSHFKNEESEELEGEYKTQIATISQMYQNIKHVTDDETIDFFHEFMDLVELSLIKLRTLDFTITEGNINFLGNLINVYRGTSGLLNLLVPFKQTLRGNNSEYWSKWMDANIARTKIFLTKKIDELFEDATALNLLPSIEELEEDAKKYQGGRESLREMLEKKGGQ